MSDHYTERVNAMEQALIGICNQDLVVSLAACIAAATTIIQHQIRHGGADKTDAVLDWIHRDMVQFRTKHQEQR